MPLSSFYRYYARTLGVNVPPNDLATLNLASPRLRFSAAAERYLGTLRVPAMLASVEARKGAGKREELQRLFAQLYAGATGMVTGTQFHALCASLDSIVGQVVELGTFPVKHINRTIVIAPHPRAEADPSFVRSLDRYPFVYFHYTDETGFDAIWGGTRKLSAFRTDENRMGARPLVYLTTPPHMYPPEQVHQVVFLGEPKYRDRGDFLFAFATRERLKVDDGTQPGEFTYAGSIDMKADDVKMLYAGRNPFHELRL